MNKVLKLLSCFRYPGKYRLFKMLDSMGFLSGPLHHKIGPYSCSVPADQFHFWSICGPQNYQIRRLARFAQILNNINDGFVFFDLGADVGAVSIQIKRLCPMVSEIIAIEPNRKSFSYLSKNLSLLKIPTQTIRSAVSNFDGTSKFSFNSSKNSDHSGHLDDTSGEEVTVMQLDSIYKGDARNVAIKIDVEGEEKHVLEGAKRIMSTCRFAGIFIEIHHDVIQRTQISAEEIFEAAERIRPFNWYVAEEGLPKVNRSGKFFEQFPEKRQYDVIGTAPND